MYTSKDKIEDYIDADIDSSYGNTLTRFIESVEAHIDNETGRTFGTANTASQRVFDGDGTDELIIDDAHDIVSVTRDIDDNALDTGEWNGLPANDTPKTAIKLDTKVFPKDTQNITVEAKWGYGEVPRDIELAATVLVAGIMNANVSTDEEVKKESFGDYSVTYKDESHWSDYERTETILENYRRHRF